LDIYWRYSQNNNWYGSLDILMMISACEESLVQREAFPSRENPGFVFQKIFHHMATQGSMYIWITVLF